MSRKASLVALLLASCSVGPDYRPPSVPIPDQFAHGDSGVGPSNAVLANWWTGFGDPQLSELIGRALTQNLDVQMAAARIREARAREIVAGAATQPQIAAKGSVTRQRISENAIPLPPGTEGPQGAIFGLPGSEFTTWRAGFDAGWELDLFGRTRRSVEAANARTAAAVWNSRDLQVTAAGEIAYAYFALRNLQSRIGNAEAELARQKRLEELVSARARGGLVTGQELEQQASEVLAAAGAIPPLRSEAQAQIHAIGVLTGDNPESLIDQLSQPRAQPQPPQIPAGVPSDLLRRRPDVRAAERELAASSADIGVAIAELFPRFSLTAAPALVSTALTSFLEWGSRSFSAGAALDWPIFNGGRTRGTIAVANARQEQALIAYRKTVLQALREVEDSLSRASGNRQKLAKLEQALASAVRAEDIASTRHRGELIPLSDVLATQARRLSLERQLIETKGELNRDTAAVFKTLGGGWPELSEKGDHE